MDLPLAVLVSGPPGAGKTTLATRLAPALHLPHISKDVLVSGVWRTRHRPDTLGETGVDIHYQVLEKLLDLGVSFVTDQTFLPELSEGDVRARLAPRGRLFNVHCFSPDCADRWETRMETDHVRGNAWVAELRPRVVEYRSTLARPLDFGCPVIEVDTSDGYDPSFDNIVAEIDRFHPPPIRH